MTNQANYDSVSSQSYRFWATPAQSLMLTQVLYVYDFQMTCDPKPGGSV